MGYMIRGYSDPTHLLEDLFFAYPNPYLMNKLIEKKIYPNLTIYKKTTYPHNICSNFQLKLSLHLLGLELLTEMHELLGECAHP
jgi:hypothetical protein